MENRKHILRVSHALDTHLAQELERCQVRGRKADLVRNYALLGHQKALALCASMQDHMVLNQALAELFAPEGAPPDYRAAAEFIEHVLKTGQGEPEQAVAVMHKPKPEPEPEVEAAPQAAPEKVEPSPRPRPQWGSALSSLVGGSSKDKGSQEGE